jgi:hypothetical protein
MLCPALAPSNTLPQVHINVGMFNNPISCDPNTCVVIGFEPNMAHFSS